MKRILLTAAGGAPAINFSRSLRDLKDKYFILGVDANEYKIFRSEADNNILCPRADSSEYIPFLNYLIKKFDIDFLHAQPDIEVGVISENRDKLKCHTFLPGKETVRILRNKYLSYEKWAANNVPVPKTILLKNPEDLDKAYDIIGNDIWIREIEGAAGKGSLASPDKKTAFDQINNCNGWGRYTAATRLSNSTITWMSIYHQGELIVSQARERLYWEASDRAQSGVTGITGTGKTISSSNIDDIAEQSVFAIDSKPNGIFSVDMTLDHQNNPCLTEINIGKFFTTHYFFTAAGVNFPEIYLKTAFGEPTDYKNTKSPLKNNLLWIRGMDIEPKLILEEKVLQKKDEYEKILKCL